MLVIARYYFPDQLIAELTYILAAVLNSSTALEGGKDWSLSNENMSDSIGLERTRENRASFLKALDDHQGIIYKICRIYCKQASDQEDLFQEVAYQLWKDFPTFQNKSSISTWMYSVAIHTATMPYKRRRVDIEFVEEIPDVPADEPGNSYVQDEFFRLVHKLSKIDRAIVMLIMDNYTHAEIAEIVGISKLAVTKRLSRLRLGWLRLK